MEFFTNAQKTENEEVDISAPAFSVTKVQAALGLVITGILGIVPTAHKDDVTVIVASIAAATLVVLGIFALVSVDMRTRQRAQEAKLRFGAPAPASASFQAMPTKGLVLQMGHNSDEYEVSHAAVDGDTVRLYGDREGDPICVTFKEVPKPS